MSRIARYIGSVVLTLLLTLITVLGSGRPVMADGTIPFDAGQACSFALNIGIVGEFQPIKKFEDKNGNVVRTLSAGKGVALTLTNSDTGAKLSLKANGSVAHTTNNPDGSMTVVATGHNLIILFDTDIPAGPSTTLYVGKVVYTIDAGGVWTLQQSSGKSTDICAALS